LQFVVSGIAIAGGLYAIRRGTGIEPPAFIKQRLDALSEWIARRFATG
jgi:hypothetical protein